MPSPFPLPSPFPVPSLPSPSALFALITRNHLAKRCWLAASICCALAASAPAQCPDRFVAGANSFVPGSPTALAVADFNLDGWPDVVVTRTTGFGVSVLLGNPAGGFSIPVSTFNGQAPQAVAVGDFNGDGLPDLVLANFGSGSGNTLSIMLGNGDGTFLPPTAVSLGSGLIGPVAVVVADLNGDGKLDVISANRTANTISVLFGNGDGTFGVPVEYACAAQPSCLALGNLLGDATPDLVVGGETGQLTIFTGSATGEFTGPLFFNSIIGGYRAVALGDINGDGRLDIALAGFNASAVLILPNRGGGSFGPASSVAVGQGPTAIALADVSADGRLDILTTSSFAGTLSVLLGNGNATFQPAINYGIGAGAGLGGFVLLDLTGDGRPEVLATTPTFSAVSVAVNMGRSVQVTTPPTSQTVAPLAQATFTIAASGAGPLSYQWRRNGVAIPSGGHFSGTTTPTLTISAATTFEAGTFDCIISSGCPSETAATTPSATLTIQASGAPPCSIADIAGGGTDGLAPDGTLDGNDFVAFINAFALGC